MLLIGLAVGESNMDGWVSNKSKMRTPDAIALWSSVYCIVKFLIGSKNRCTNRPKATRVPTFIAPSITSQPPKLTTKAVESPTIISTEGNIPAESLDALRFASR